MTNSIEELIRDRLVRKSGKEFQQLIWGVLICHYSHLQTTKMIKDFGSDGHDFDEKIFFAVYAPELPKYDNKETIKKITNPYPGKSEELGDYEKFVKNWKSRYDFERWVFITKDNLMGAPNATIAELNNNGDGIKKEHWGLEKIVKLSLELKESDLLRIYNLEGINTSVQTQSIEVETIIELIDYISNNAELNEGDFDSVMPDPEKKIRRRFAEHCKEIENGIVEGMMYAKARREAENVVGLDKIKTGIIVAYLKSLSRRKLRESDNDPIVALDKITDYFEKIFEQKGIEFSSTAIKYYLISEIPKCNIFPNDD